MVSIRGLAFGYTKERLFKNLNLDLAAGNVYGLLGKNGAGKTTLLKILCGLRLAQMGVVRVLDSDPGKRPAAMLEELYFLPEEFYLPPLAPGRYVEIYSPFYPRFSRELMREYSQEFELEVGKKLSELSYGQKKKFLVAFGLATGARLLLLDEPTNGMDIPSKGQFRRLLARAGSEERTVLISTHQVRDMENLIDPIIILDQGSVIFQQPLQEASRKLAASLERSAPSNGGALYVEKTLGGYVVVRPSEADVEANLDLETLFNTVVASRDKVGALFGEPVTTREA